MIDANDKNFLDIDYCRDGLPFIELAGEIESQNARLVATKHEAEIELLHDGLNIMYAIASEFMWTFNASHIVNLNKANSILFSTLHKNLIALYTGLKLTRTGLYGPARSILRHVYEALLIAKFCSVSHSTHIYEKWEEGDVVYLTV